MVGGLIACFSFLGLSAAIWAWRDLASVPLSLSVDWCWSATYSQRDQTSQWSACFERRQPLGQVYRSLGLDESSSLISSRLADFSSDSMILGLACLRILWAPVNREFADRRSSHRIDQSCLYRTRLQTLKDRQNLAIDHQRIIQVALKQQVDLRIITRCQ